MKQGSCKKISGAEIWIRMFSAIMCTSPAYCSTVEYLCNELIPKNYEVYKAPTNNGKSLNVFIGFQVLDISEINEETMDFHLHLFIMYAWNDTRLKLKRYTELGRPAILYSKCRQYIWTPDVYFETAKKIETFKTTSPTTILNIFQDSSIVMSVRYTFKTDCPMNFQNYPFDAQKCHFYVSLMYSHDAIAVLKWLDDKECPIRNPPIQMMRNANLLQHYLLEPEINSHTRCNQGNYTNLVATFTIVRRLTGCVISTYAPSVLIVIMSWVSFWLRMDAIPARVALSITSLLTLCTQAQTSKSQLPAVNYMTAMDIWLFMCIIMVFSTLLISALSYNVFSKQCKSCSPGRKVDKAPNKESKGTNISSHPWILRNNKRMTFAYTSADSLDRISEENCPQCRANQKLGHRIDDYSKILFPATFIIASIFYCSYYLTIYYNHY